jgi:tRNA(Ile)-lysidine synthase
VAVAKTASPEAAAREARYRVFSRNLGPGDALFLAHHRDDQVETLLLRLLRGAGPRGMSAMPRRRQLGQGQLFRPLLSLTRDALQAYAKGAGLRWLDDPSNLDDQLDRNFLRNQVLPLVASRWPGYRATLARASQLLGEQEDLLEELTGQSELRRNRFGEVGLPLEQLPGDEPALTARRLRSFVRSQGLPVPSRESLTEFLRQLATAADAAGITLETAGWVLQVFDGVVWLLPSGPVPPTDWSGQLALGQSLELGWLGRVVLDVDEAGPLRLVPGETLNLRLRGGGEMVSTPAGRRSLKKLLQEARIPPWWRARLPLLYRGEQLLAVADIATATGQGAASGVGCRLRWFPPRAN